MSMIKYIIIIIILNSNDNNCSAVHREISVFLNKHLYIYYMVVTLMIKNFYLTRKDENKTDESFTASWNCYQQ